MQNVFKNARVSDNAKVYGDAWVSGDAKVSGNAKVYGDACVYGNAYVYGKAKVYGNACVYGNAWVYGNADISSNEDWFSIIFDNKTITAYRSRNEQGYEINVDGGMMSLEDIIDDLSKNQISQINSWKKPEKSETDIRIENLEKELEALKAARKAEKA